MDGQRRNALEKLAGSMLLVGGALGARLAGAQPASAPSGAVAEMRLLGVLATAALQNAWLLLEVTTLAWKEQGVSEARVRGIADALTQQLAMVSRGLQSLDPNRLAEDDQVFVEQARRCCRSLQLVARSLVRWLDRPALAESRTVDRALRAASEAVRELTGEPDSPGSTPPEE
jgi:hypothetical protein